MTAPVPDWRDYAASPAAEPPAPAEPRLRVLPTVGKAWSGRLPDMPFALLVFAVLLAGMVGYLVLQTTLQKQAFALNDLRAEANALKARESYLEAGLASRTTPLELALAARELGMVANPYGSFIDLRTGQVTGVNQPVRGDELPLMNPPPPPPPPAPVPPPAEEATAVDPPAADDPDAAAAAGNPDAAAAADTAAADPPTDAVPPDAAAAQAETATQAEATGQTDLVPA